MSVAGTGDATNEVISQSAIDSAILSRRGSDGGVHPGGLLLDVTDSIVGGRLDKVLMGVAIRLVA